MNLYSLHVHVAVQGGPLLGAPLVGIRILHFTDLNRHKTKIFFFKKLKYAITKSTTTNSNGQVFQVHHHQDKNSNIFNKKKIFNQLTSSSTCGLHFTFSGFASTLPLMRSGDV